MPYILSPLIIDESPGMWNEEYAYKSKSLYRIEKDILPPVNYDEHLIRSHSLTHLEFPAHTQENGNKLGFFIKEKINFFYGKVLLIKLNGNNYKNVDKNLWHWEISVNEIKERLIALGTSLIPDKLLITTRLYFENAEGYHDPRYVLTLSLDSAKFLTSNNNFNLYGTSWKSSDFNSGHSRPIHNQLFTQAIIMENLKLNHVPEGLYFMTAFPVPIANASESPVLPVLFNYNEILEN